MDALLMSYIHDPLYRLAVWIIFIQLGLITASVLITILIRWVKPQLEQRRAVGEERARRELLQLLTQHQDDTSHERSHELFEEVSMRFLISAYEQIVTRLGVVEQRALRASPIAHKIEVYALKLTHSWFSWRRLEGVLILRSVGARSAEERLIVMLRDSNPRVAFYAAWALVRVSPRRGQGYVIEYIDSEEGLSKSQRVHLMCELHLEVLELDELRELFSSLSARLKPVMIEAVIESRHTLALPLVRDAIQDVEAEVRIAAFKAAATSRLGLTESELILGLEDEVWPVRAQAVKAVGASKAINLIPQVCAGLSDREWWVRQNSAQVLANLGAPGIEALCYVERFSEDRFARDAARLKLVEVAPDQLEAMNALDTQPMTPLGFDEQVTPSSQHRLINPSAPHALLTAEVSALSTLEPLPTPSARAQGE